MDFRNVIDTSPFGDLPIARQRFGCVPLSIKQNHSCTFAYFVCGPLEGCWGCSGWLFSVVENSAHCFEPATPVSIRTQVSIPANQPPSGRMHGAWIAWRRGGCFPVLLIAVRLLCLQTKLWCCSVGVMSRFFSPASGLYYSRLFSLPPPTRFHVNFFASFPFII